MRPFLISDNDHPRYDQLTQVDDLDVTTLWALQAQARQKQKGLVAYVSNPISRGLLSDHDFQVVAKTYFARLNIRDFPGEPVVTVAELAADLRQELLILLQDHYERTHQLNPVRSDIAYDQWLFDNPKFDREHSIVRLSQQHIVAAILLFQTTDAYDLGWTFGDDVVILHELWRDLLGILPVGSRLNAAFDSTDVLAMSVYETFNWHDTAPPQDMMLWRDIANNLRII